MSDTRRLAQELYEIRALALSHATSPQVGSSSVDGDGLVFRDGEGNDLGRIGGDGGGLEVEYLYGPKPDQPSAPIVSADTNFISVRWDGLWADGAATTDPEIVEPGSLDRVEVHVSSDENFVPDPINSFAGVVPITPEGGVVVVGPLAEAGDWYVVLMARGKDQQYGAPSERVHVVTTVGLMENELFDLALRAGEAMESADGKNSVYYGDEEPQPLPRLDENGDPVLDEDGNPLFHEFSEGDIWFGVGNMPHVWSETDGWVSVQDARIQEVEDALAAFEEEIDTVLENGVGTNTHYSPTEPPVADSAEGDLWFDTSEGGGNALRRFTDGVWVSVADERVAAIQDAQAELESGLNAVRDTADGKNRTFYQSTMPATPPARSGDLWFNTANGYRLHRHNGTTFIEVADGRIADLESEVENIDISGPLSEARAEWLADAATDAQAKAQAAAAAAEAAAKLYADAVATGAVEGELEGIQDYADQAADAARQAAIDAAIAEARVIANTARDEALAAALDADAVISQTVAQFENDLNVVRQSADGKSKITWSTSAASGAGKAGDTWFRMSGNNIIGHWRHSGSAWVSMSLDATVIPNLDAGKIVSGTIDAERIGAGSITADKLLVGDFTNMFTDAAFDNPTGYGVWSVVDRGLEQIGTNTQRGTYFTATQFTAKAGDSFYARFRRENVTGASGRTSIYIRQHDATGAILGTNIVAEVTGEGVGEGSFTAWREGTAYCVIGLFNQTNVNPDTLVRVTEVEVRRMTGATLIENGAITTDKIKAGAVGATAIAAESIDASKIVAGGIQADSLIVPGSVGTTQIKDGAITTSKIEAGAITAQSGIIASLDAGVISSGYIDSERIAAASIRADQILVGGAGNLLTNPGFTGGGAGWGLGGYDPIITDSGGPTGEPVLSAQRSSGLFLYLGGLAQSVAGSFAPDLAAVEAGKRYAASVWVRADVDIPVGNAGMGFRLRELGSATLGWAFPATATNREVIPANTWAKIEGEFLVPTGTGTWNRLAFGLRANGALNGRRVEFSAPVLLPMVGGTLIESGAITTDKIATGAITAESGIIGSIDAGKITVGQLDGARIKANSILASSVLINSSIGSTLIADGAITTDKINAGAVTTEKITAGGIDAGVITTGELRGELIRAGSIAASALAATAIDGKTITGATVRTSAAGARVEMNAQGLRQYNQFNQAIVDMTGGDVTVLGSLYSGVVGSSRVQIDSRLWAEGMFVPNPDGTMSNMLGAGVRVGREPEHSMDMFHGDYLRPGGASGEAGVLRGPGATAAAAMYMTDRGEAWVRSTVGGERRIDMSFLPDNSAWQSTSAWGGQNLVAQAHRARSWGAGRHGHHQVWATSNAHSGVITVDTGQASGSAESAMEWRARRQGSGADSQFILSGSYSRMDYNANYVVANASGVTLANGSNTVVVSGIGTTVRGSTLTLQSTDDTVLRNGRLYAPNMNTGSGTDLIITSNNYIGKKSSSRRYKIAEEPIEHTMPEITDALMSVDVKTWFDRQAAERVADVKTANMMSVDATDDLDDVDPLRRIPGVVAEDLDEVGLGMFVVYNPDGTPESVMYDRLGVALLPLVRDLRSRVDELETTLKEMADA